MKKHNVVIRLLKVHEKNKKLAWFFTKTALRRVCGFEKVCVIVFLVGEKGVEEGEAHRRLVLLRVLLRRVELGEVADEQPHVLDGLLLADVVADERRRNRRLRVRRDLDAAQLREVEADDGRQRRVNLLLDRVAASVLVVVGGCAVHAVHRLAHVPHHLVDEVGRLVRAPDVIRHRQALHLLRAVLGDVVFDHVVLVALHVDVEQVVPDVGVAAVLRLLVEDVLAAHLVDVAVVGAHDETVRALVGEDLVGALLERQHVRVLDRQLLKLVGVVRVRALGGLVAREDVEDLRVVLAELLRVVHHADVLVVDEEETVGLLRRKARREILAAHPNRLVEHLAVRLGRVTVARAVDVRNRRGAEEPLLLVVVDEDHRPLVRLLDKVGVLRLLAVLLGRQALWDLVGQRDHNVLAGRLGDVDDDAARLLVKLLEVLDIRALVGVVEEDELVALEDLLDLEHRVVLLGLEVVLEVVVKGDVRVLLGVGLDDLEHLGNVREVGRVHLF